jgi:serine/threonine protein kinase
VAYLADDTSSTPYKTVVVKWAKDPVDATQLKEVTLLRALDRHPNIIRLLDHYELDHHLHIVMEFASGGDLGGFVTMRVTSLAWDFSTAVGLMVDIADGLRFVHAKKIWHRDLKPANILISSDGKAMLSDFGESRRTDTLRSTVTKGVGTPLYMAPEVMDVSDA